MSPRLLNVKRAAEYLGVPEKTLRRWVWNRQIVHVKASAGRSATVLFDIRDLDRWIDAHKVPADAT